MTTLQSIPDQILNVFELRLRSAIGTNGIVNVVRPQRDGENITVQNGEIVLQHEDMEPGELSCPGNPPAVSYMLPVLVAAIVMPTKRDAEPIDKRMCDMIFAAFKAVTEPDNWHTFDGLCIHTDWPGPPSSFVPDDETARGTFQRYRCTFRVFENDPFTLAQR